MAKSNNIILVLAIVLLLVSLFGTFTLLGKINFETPSEPSPGVQKGEVKFVVLPIPEPSSMSTTGHIGFVVNLEE